MGLLTQASILMSSSAFVGYFGLRHLRRIVTEIEVPQWSILSQHFQNVRQSSPEKRHYADAFQTELPPHFHCTKGTIQQKFNVDMYVRAFYTSWIFKAEKTILKVLFQYPDPKLSKFEVGQSIYAWEIHSRNDHEILLTWQLGVARGSTWFCVPRNENVMMFGTSLETPRLPITASEPDNEDGSFAKLHSFTYLEKSKTFIERVKSTFIRLRSRTLMAFHRTYSLILVNAVRRKVSNQV